MASMRLNCKQKISLSWKTLWQPSTCIFRNQCASLTCWHNCATKDPKNNCHTKYGNNDYQKVNDILYEIRFNAPRKWKLGSTAWFAHCFLSVANIMNLIFRGEKSTLAVAWPTNNWQLPKSYQWHLNSNACANLLLPAYGLGNHKTNVLWGSFACVLLLSKVVEFQACDVIAMK